MSHLASTLVFALVIALVANVASAQHVCDADHSPKPISLPPVLGAYGGDYSCDPQTCQPPDCLCASVDPPGPTGANRAFDEVPQFVLITYDDCVDEVTHAIISDLEIGLLNPDGREVPATYFVSGVNCWGDGGISDAGLINELYLTGNEIASHTYTHAVPHGASVDEWHGEMTSLDNFLVQAAGVNPEHITGFRAPYVATSDPMFEAVQNRGFDYEASLFEQPLWNYSMSSGVDSYVWPHTMDHGTPISCGFFSGNNCPSESIEGLWMIPLYFYVDPRGEEAPPDSIYYGAFDPGGPLSGGPILHGQELHDLLWWNFEQRYHGNRAPLNMFLHASNLDEPERRETLRAFLTDVLAQDDVWAVTMQGLIRWMRDPVPAAEMEAWYAAYCDDFPCGMVVSPESEPPPIAAETLAVFPSPARDHITIRLDAPDAQRLSVIVYDILGRRVLERELDARHESRLDIQSLSPGTYLYRVAADERHFSGRLTILP